MQNAGMARRELGGATLSHENVLKLKVGCDVTFEVGPTEEIISCHKIFLIARSSVFEVMFEDRWTNNHGIKGDSETIKLLDVESGIFQSFLVFIYTDLIDLADMSCENIDQLLYLAEKYNVFTLKNRCEELLMSMLSLNNVIHIHSIANLYSFIQLSETTEYMMTKKFWELISDPSFLTMDAAVLERFVASDYTTVKELELFNALIKWSKFQCKNIQLEPTGSNLRSVLGAILAHIRFPVLGRLVFSNFVIPSKILTEQEQLDILEYISLDREGRANFEASRSGLKLNTNRRKTVAQFKAKKLYSDYQEIQSTRGPGAAESHLNLMKRKVRCDVTFEVGRGKELISSHTIFLIARSSVFQVMFEDRWTNHGNKRDDDIIKLPDVESGIFQSFLKFIYADLIEPADESVPTLKKLLYLAEKYNVLNLRNRCEKIFLSMLAVNNVIQIHAIAEQFSLIQLLATAEKKITSEFWRLIWEASFLTMNTTLLARFVASDDTNVDELNLFCGLMNWSKYQCKKLNLKPSGENLRTVLGPILAHIRFPLMGSWKFFEYVAPRKILTKEEKWDILGYTRLPRKDRDNFDVSRLGFKVHARKGFSKQK